MKREGFQSNLLASKGWKSRYLQEMFGIWWKMLGFSSNSTDSRSYDGGKSHVFFSVFSSNKGSSYIDQHRLT